MTSFQLSSEPFQYILKRSNRLVFLGNNDQTDIITPHYVPNHSTIYPFQVGSGVVAFNKTW